MRLTRAGAGVRLQVEDTGSGIDPAFLPHVFDPFRQADSSMTRPHGGLGLGLAIVRHLVELHGGTIAAASAGVGHGATFTVKLPVARQETPRPRPLRPQRRSDGRASPRMRPTSPCSTSRRLDHESPDAQADLDLR